MSQPGPRIAREQRTIGSMVDIYCRDHHPPDGWHRCSACEELLSYAQQRLAHCPFQEAKPVCSACPVHCYRPEMRLKAKEVMRHAGPKMILYHPVAAILHLFEEHGRAPEHPRLAKLRAKQGLQDQSRRENSLPDECMNIPLPPVL